MKFLVLGINPSGENRKLPEDFDEKINFNTNSPSDKKIKEALANPILDFKRDRNYKVTDIIKHKMTKKEFQEKSPEEKLKLAEENAPNVIKKAKDFGAKFVLLLSKTDWPFKGFSEFIDSLEKQMKTPIIRVWHPRYAVRSNKSIEEYAEHIKSRIKK